MERSDWTMLAISFAQGQGLSPVQLQKVLFLLGRQLPDEVGPGYYDFVPHNYGPFAGAIYRDAMELSMRGLVSIDSGQRFSRYSPTPSGLEYAGKLKQLWASQKAIAYLEKTVTWAQSLSFSALVRAIYAKYPEFRENSVFQG